MGPNSGNVPAQALGGGEGGRFSPSRLLGKFGEFTINSFVFILEINDPQN